MSKEKTNNFTLYNHCKDKQGRRFTVAAVVEDGLLNAKVSLGIARCSSKDNFNKKIGRAIAEGRATKRPIEISKVSKTDAFVEAKNFMYETCNKIAEDVSQWV